MDTRMPTYEVPSVRHARRARRAWWAGLLASVAIHLGAFTWWRAPIVIGEGPDTARERPVRPAAGGAMSARRIRFPVSREIPPPPAPVVDIAAPEIEIREPSEPAMGIDLAMAAPAAAGPGPAFAAAAGDGSGADGEGGIVPPVPRSILPHWDPPPSVRGMEVTVRVFVDADGRPTGMVQLVPPTPDREFNREIEDHVRRMAYRPALDHGVPVAAWAEIVFIF